MFRLLIFLLDFEGAKEGGQGVVRTQPQFPCHDEALQDRQEEVGRRGEQTGHRGRTPLRQPHGRALW